MGNIEFGLRIPSFPVDGSEGREFIRQIVRFVSDLEENFSSAWVCDHFYPWADFVQKTTPTIEGFTAISYLSAIFRRLKFGNIVLCNSYRNPALLAKMGATLQLLSGGRFILGIGAGWKRDEYISYGYEFPSAKIRIQQLEEAIQIIRMMWNEGKATFKGRYYRVEDATCFPKPEPVPPIMIGGGGEKLTLRVVAKYADWWNLPNVSVETFRRKLEILEKHCERVDRRPEEIKKTLANIVAISKSMREAKRILSKSPFSKIGDPESFIVGDVDAVTDRISRYVDLGIEHFILRFLDFPRTDGARLFAEKIIPNFT